MAHRTKKFAIVAIKLDMTVSTHIAIMNATLLGETCPGNSIEQLLTGTWVVRLLKEMRLSDVFIVQALFTELK